MVASLTNLTNGTGAPPGSTKGRAAFGLQRGSIDVDLTPPVDDSLPAGALDGFCRKRGVMDTEQNLSRNSKYTPELQID